MKKEDGNDEDGHEDDEDEKEGGLKLIKKNFRD